MTRFIFVFFATISTFGPTHLAMAGSASDQNLPPALDLAPVATENLEQDSNAHRGLNTPIEEPRSGFQSQSLLDQAGLNPDIDASAKGIGASQRIDIGGEHLAETRTTIQPYLELGANAERRQDAALFERNGLDADLTAEIGGGTTVSVNDQIDLRLGYTHEEPLGSASIAGEADDKVETGVSVKF